MKIAVLNFSGNVGKTTVARHLLLPRIPGAELIAVESVNADGETHGGNTLALRGRQFAAWQEYLQTIDSAVVDIGASNLDELLGLMQLYCGSHEDFDCFIVPTVPALKQQQDTIATLIELTRLGVPPERVKLVFNMTETGIPVEDTFYLLMAFLAENPLSGRFLQTHDRAPLDPAHAAVIAPQPDLYLVFCTSRSIAFAFAHLQQDSHIIGMHMRHIDVERRL